jgi:DNA invertase Pin-like site-specific DNA recombinase
MERMLERCAGLDVHKKTVTACVRVPGTHGDRTQHVRTFDTTIAEFERDLIRDRVVAGLRRAKAQGRRLGRPRRHHVDVEAVRALLAGGLSLRAVARRLNMHPMVVRRATASA